MSDLGKAGVGGSIISLLLVLGGIYLQRIIPNNIDVGGTVIVIGIGLAFLSLFIGALGVDIEMMDN